MFRLIHRDSDGRLLLDARVAGLGLSAALLGELLLADRAVLRDGFVLVAEGAPPGDVLAHAVLDQVSSEPVHHPVRTWLAYLARGSRAQVAARLVRGGQVREHRSRGLFGRSVRYVPVDMNAAAWPWARLSTRLRAGEPLDVFDTVLAGLVLATDLHRIVLLGAADDLAGELRRVVATAPVMIRELIYHTEAAVGDAVITST
ncbi:GOLPH3/VPS74 family protein [Paractinoplanes rishiriensis]|nr:GPP34 family phosphoprotein [Actinoplanes rishiriensis]